MSDWVAGVLSAMTLEEKIGLLAGRDNWETGPAERLGVPALKMTDGPNGARGADANHGPGSTSFPVGAAMGATFDPDLIEQVGRALAHETRAKGADVLLGPTVNIPRVPVAGRNFECFSEDPTLSGTLAAAYVQGLQAEGIGACIKHFVCNDQEHERRTISASVDDRTLREVYLEPFRIAVERSHPWAVMSAYNAINGVTASEHPMLDDVLRAEFGFDGAVISDWYGTYSPSVISSGLDLEMPGPARWVDPEHVRRAIEDESVDETIIDTKVRRLLTLFERTGAHQKEGQPAERADELDEHRELARRVARDSIVLLENKILPLTNPSRIAVIGEPAAKTPFQGGGSSSVNPHRVVSILQGLEAAAPAGAAIEWATGPPIHRYPQALDPLCLSHDDDARGLLVEYFAGTEFSGTPVRALPTKKSLLFFTGPDDSWADNEEFSVRLSGRFRASSSGRHAFSVSAGGCVRAVADGAVVVDAWDGDATDPQYWEADLVENQELELLIEYASRPAERKRWIRLGCEPPAPDDPIRDACLVAARADLAVVVVGLTPEWESEGFDRVDLALPGEQNRLVEEVAAAQPNTVVIVVAGSAVEMPWRNKAAAVLHVWYGGQEIGHAVAEVLFGRVDPGGRLPVTFPLNSEQHPGMLNYPGEAGTVRYGEGVYVGYRGFDRLGLEPMYSFGYGLSYTTFSIADVAAGLTNGRPALSATLTNLGERTGVEVVQVFARDIGGVPRRLVGFQKYEVAAGASIAVEIPILPEHLRWWDPALGGWTPATGAVEFEVRGTFGTEPATIDLSASP